MANEMYFVVSGAIEELGERDKVLFTMYFWGIDFI
jgi:hypothetical protein